jgi:predicted AAA+ superfamily ATPase
VGAEFQRYRIIDLLPLSRAEFLNFYGGLAENLAAGF